MVITARPSYSRIKTALTAIKNHPALELQLVVASSALLDRYGSAVNHIESDGFMITARVFNVLEGENLTAAAKTTGIGILELSTVFENLKPDVVVTVADRFETMSTAVAAAYMNIPLAHVQGGEVTGNIDEKVRHAITKLADIHLVSTDRARERVIKMGENPSAVFVTGCPSIDLAKEILTETTLNFNPFEKYGGVGNKVDISGGYIVVLQHPVTTEYNESRAQVETTLRAIGELGVPTCWFWPNVDAGSDGTSKGIRAFREYNGQLTSRIHFFKNMEGQDFLRLLLHAKCLIGNSSVGIRECSYLGVPVVNIGSRQAGRERGINVLDADYTQESIHHAVSQQINHGPYPSDTVYGDGAAGEKIADLLSECELSIEKKLMY